MGVQRHVVSGCINWGNLGYSVGKQACLCYLLAMARTPPTSEDEKYHYEIWSGPSEAYAKAQPSISYVENHNAEWDYGLAAFDFKMAADALIAHQKRDPHLGNWTAPICHLVRQTIELQLKSLLQMISWKHNKDQKELAFTHNVERLWADGKEWLVGNGYPIATDSRLTDLDRLVANLHSIDPAGDLFRFGTSKFHAFGRAKTYDRVGYDQDILFSEFERAYQCAKHWSSVVMREIIMKEEGWNEDPFFDPDDFPRA